MIWWLLLGCGTMLALIGRLLPPKKRRRVVVGYDDPTTKEYGNHLLTLERINHNN